jgi:mRNA interferase YafQ
LAEVGKLPSAYQDHLLVDRPWGGFNEFHVLDDVLVVYYKVESKRRIRMTAITNHKRLRIGKKP